MLELIIAAVSFIFIIGILVVTHEWGHYFFARRFGVKVHEFAFGMPPRLWGKKYGATEWVINALPIGGYVRLHGEDGGDSQDPQSFASKPAWQRLIILLAGSLVHLIMAVIIFTGFRFFEGRPVLHQHLEILQVEDASQGQQASLQSGDEIVKLAGQYIKSQEELSQLLIKNAGQEIEVEYFRQTDQDRQEMTTTLLIPAADQRSYQLQKSLQILDIEPNSPAKKAGLQDGQSILQLEDQSLNSFQDWTEIIPEETPTTISVLGPNGLQEKKLNSPSPTDDLFYLAIIIDEVIEDSPAWDAGFRIGDRIVAINSQTITNSDDFLETLEDQADQETSFTFWRFMDNQLHTLRLQATPRSSPPPGQGALGILFHIEKIGWTQWGLLFQPTADIEPLGLSLSLMPTYDLVPVSHPAQAIVSGTQDVWLVTSRTAEAIGGLVAGLFTKAQVSDDVQGLPKVAQYSGAIAQDQGIIGLLWLMALLATNLAVFNLMPFPGLDGGRIIFVLIEMIRGQKISPENESLVHGIGIALLLVLIAFVTFRDVLSFF